MPRAVRKLRFGQNSVGLRMQGARQCKNAARNPKFTVQSERRGAPQLRRASDVRLPVRLRDVFAGAKVHHKRLRGPNSTLYGWERLPGH